MPVTLPSYDETKVLSTSLTPSQIGLSTAPGVYVDLSGLPGQLNTGVYMALSYDFSINNDAERGLALGPRLPFTAATDDLAGTGETATTWDLTITAVVPAPFVFTVVGLTSHTPPIFSDGNDPHTYIVTEGASFVVALDVITATSTSSTTSIDFHSNYLETVTGATITRPFHDMVNDPLWNGLFQFAIVPVSGITSGVTAATFSGNTHRWHTGSPNFPLDRRARVVKDYITGQTYLSDEAVPDGYRDGIMVHPDNYDPPDPLDTDSYTPPPGEGVVDDDVIDVER
jgi:hypothetical protein